MAETNVDGPLLPIVNYAAIVMIFALTLKRKSVRAASNRLMPVMDADSIISVL